MKGNKEFQSSLLSSFSFLTHVSNGKPFFSAQKVTLIIIRWTHFCLYYFDIWLSWRRTPLFSTHVKALYRLPARRSDAHVPLPHHFKPPLFSPSPVNVPATHPPTHDVSTSHPSYSAARVLPPFWIPLSWVKKSTFTFPNLLFSIIQYLKFVKY